MRLRPSYGECNLNKKVLVLAGGGGHTGYAYALAQALHGKVELSFLAPEGDGLSEKKLRRFGEVNFLIKPRGPKTPHYIFIPRLFRAFIQSLRKVSGEFDVVVSTGSNFCVPPALIAWARGIPLVNIESCVRFTRASITARILQRFSKITVLQWEDQKKILSGVVVGPLLPKPEVKPRNEGYILVTGGTIGHKLLFDTVSESELKNVVLQTGKINPEPYKRKHPEWKIITLTERFDELVAGADIVITHFGSTALEAATHRKPTVIVLNPEWKRTVGLEDANILAKKLNSVLIYEINLDALLNAIEEAKKRKTPEMLDGARVLGEKIIKL